MQKYSTASREAKLKQTKPKQTGTELKQTANKQTNWQTKPAICEKSQSKCVHNKMEMDF